MRIFLFLSVFPLLGLLSCCRLPQEEDFTPRYDWSLASLTRRKPITRVEFQYDSVVKDPVILRVIDKAEEISDVVRLFCGDRRFNGIVPICGGLKISMFSGKEMIVKIHYFDDEMIRMEYLIPEIMSEVNGRYLILSSKNHELVKSYLRKNLDIPKVDIDPPVEEVW